MPLVGQDMSQLMQHGVAGLAFGVVKPFGRPNAYPLATGLVALIMGVGFGTEAATLTSFNAATHKDTFDFGVLLEHLYGWHGSPFVYFYPYIIPQ